MWMFVLSPSPPAPSLFPLAAFCAPFICRILHLLFVYHVSIHSTTCSSPFNTVISLHTAWLDSVLHLKPPPQIQSVLYCWWSVITGPIIMPQPESKWSSQLVMFSQLLWLFRLPRWDPVWTGSILLHRKYSSQSLQLLSTFVLLHNYVSVWCISVSFLLIFDVFWAHFGS